MLPQKKGWFNNVNPFFLWGGGVVLEIKMKLQRHRTYESVLQRATFTSVHCTRFCMGAGISFRNSCWPVAVIAGIV